MGHFIVPLDTELVSRITTSWPIYALSIIGILTVCGVGNTHTCTSLYTYTDFRYTWDDVFIYQNVIWHNLKTLRIIPTWCSPVSRMVWVAYFATHCHHSIAPALLLPLLSRLVVPSHSLCVPCILQSFNSVFVYNIFLSVWIFGHSVYLFCGCPSSKYSRLHCSVGLVE